jgi:uncharacterized protein YbjT (DUF2867 family)
VRVAVFGASGTIGRALVPLLAGDHEVVAVSRRPRPPAGGTRWARADALNPSEVRRAVDGAEVVYYLVHSLGSADFERRDRRAAEITARAAASAGVGQIVYLGGLGEPREELSQHLRSRRETGERLRAAGVPLTTLRAAVVIGPGSAAFETMTHLVDRLPVMVCPRWVSTPTQPIALHDVARYLAAVCGRADALGETFDVGGPDVMSYRAMLERVAALRGRRTRLITVPVLSPRLSALWLHLVTPVDAGVARPLVDGLRNATLVRDERLRERVPFPLTPFDEAAREALAAAGV